MDMKIENITALVVTYNRKDLLRECLEAILMQSYPISSIILIDNASTDGTDEMLNSEGYLNNALLKYVRMEKNTGGAGGFYEGLRMARETDCDWVWVMDDDTIPKTTCLERLVSANELIEKSDLKDGLDSTNSASFLASVIYGEDGEYMNVPEISRKQASNGYCYWYKYLKNRIVGIDSSTFVSVLIRHDAINKCGLPCKDFFIWGDDTEYTLRLSTFYGDGYLVGDSEAIHKRIGAKSLDIANETDPKRIKMYHYLYRNNLIHNHYYNRRYRGALLEMLKALIQALKNIKIKPYGLIRAKSVLKGSLEGIFKYKRFKNYIDSELGDACEVSGLFLK